MSSSGLASPTKTPQNSLRLSLHSISSNTARTAGSDQVTPRDQVQDYQGITIRGLRHFIDTTCGGQEKIVHMTIDEVYETFIVPLVRTANKSVVEHISVSEPTAKQLTASNCLLISCHSWTANFLEYVDMLEYHLSHRHNYDNMTDRRLPLVSERYRPQQADTRSGDERSPDGVPVWIDCFCINPIVDNKDDSKDQSLQWSRAIQTACQDLSYVLFFLHPWNDVKLLQNIQTYFILYWATVQSLQFQIVFSQEVDPSFVNAIATSAGVDMLIKLWSIPKDIDLTCQLDRPPVCGAKHLKKMLLTITNWDTVARKVYMLLRTELRKLGNQLTQEVLSSPLLSDRHAAGDKGTDVQLMSIISAGKSPSKTKVVISDDPIEKALLRLEVKVNTAKTLLITVEEAVANDQFQKTKEELQRDRDDIVLLLQDIAGACKAYCPKDLLSTGHGATASSASRESTARHSSAASNHNTVTSGPQPSAAQLDRLKTFLVEVGQLFMATRQYETAIIYLQEGLEHFTTKYTDKHDVAMRCQGNIGVCYHQLCDYLQAEVVLQTIQEDYKGTSPAMKGEYLTFCYYLGCLHYDLGKYSQAEGVLLDTLQQQVSLLSQQHTDTLRTMLKVGYLYNIQRKFSHAEDIFRQYLAGSAWIYSKYHKDVLNVKQNLGNLLLLQWKYDEADEIFQQVLDVMVEMYGELHLNTMEVIVAMGHNYLRQERFQKAEDCYLHALQCATRLHGGVDVVNVNGTGGEAEATPKGKERAKSVISCHSHPLIKLYRGYYEKALEAALEFEVMKKTEEDEKERARMQELIDSEQAKHAKKSGGLFGAGTNSSQKADSPSKKTPKKIKRANSRDNTHNSSDGGGSRPASREGTAATASSTNSSQPTRPLGSSSSSATCNIM